MAYCIGEGREPSHNTSAALAVEALAHGPVLGPPPRTLAHVSGESRLGMGCGAADGHHPPVQVAPTCDAAPKAAGGQGPQRLLPA
eukprot:5119509-Karenia_brevis.AAC.1